MLKKLAHFSTGSTFTNFQENEDGSITKSALVFVEGNHCDNRGRSWNCPSDFVETIVENTNRAFNEGRHIPILKDHTKTIDAEIGVLDAPLEARIITEEDLPNQKHKDLIGKLGVFCDGIVLKAKDVVERVKQGLNKTLSPGIDMKNMVLKEISLTPTPAIKSLSLFSEGKDMSGVFTLDDADALSQDDEQLEEEFEDLSKKFYCVLKNIIQNGEELGEEADMMVEKVFADYEMRLRDLFGLTGEIPDEDDAVADTQSNGYSLQNAPGMVPQNDYAPYSLYSVDSAEFAFGQEWLGKTMKNMSDSYKRYNKVTQKYGKEMGNAFQQKRYGDVMNLGKRFYTNKGGGLRMGRIGMTAGGLGAIGAAGYGAYKLGRAGLGAVGIGRKEEKRPWYRF